MICALLALACLPTLLLNVGAGRSVLLHKHQASSFHGHVLAASGQDDHYGHAGHHEAGDHEHHEDAERPLAGDVVQPVEPCDGAMIRGTEVASATNQNTATEVPPAISFAVPFLWAAPVPAAVPPLRAHDPPVPIRRAELTSLRVVVLLI